MGGYSISVEGSAETNSAVDWDLISDYLEIFQLDEKLALMKDWHGPIDPD